jgi:endonuclease YncB( thermonuclease family)
MQNEEGGSGNHSAGRGAEERAAAVARRLARRRWVRRGVFSVAALLLASVFMAQAGLLGRSGDDWAAFDRGSVEVVAVIEGDLLTVRPTGGGRETRVRLVGIDAPDAPGHWAAESKQHLIELALGKRMTLRLEPTQTRAADGSLLAYVHPDDGPSLNLLMVRDGHAYADRRSVHTLQSVFDQEETDARRKGRGLWKSVEEHQMPAWRQQWLRELREKKAANQRRPATTRSAD